MRKLLGPEGHPRRGEAELLEKAIEGVRALFPFPNVEAQLEESVPIVKLVMKHLADGCVLDFGCGVPVTSALLALTGYRVFVCDDLCDRWHLEHGNRERILHFARSVGMDFFVGDAVAGYPYRDDQFDLVLINDVLEHLHDSPYPLLCDVLDSMKPRALLFITVPNAASLRKRVALLIGRTNYPPYREFFWYPPPWRGHVREYVLDDLLALSRYLRLEVVQRRDIHRMVAKRLKARIARTAYYALMSMVPIPGLRDSLLLLARKPDGWNREWVAATTLSGQEADHSFSGRGDIRRSNTGT